LIDQTAENLRDISPQMTTSKLHFHAQAGVVDLLDDEPIDQYTDTIKQLDARTAKKLPSLCNSSEVLV
jgi:hypothetical protein